jgi:predicted porin
LAENNVKGVLWAPNLTLEKIAMKKTLIALAVLASSGAAMAQSTFTLYGIADAAVEYTKGGTPVVAPATGASASSAPRHGLFAVSSGNLNGSRWGLRGSEDLGGGLKGVFTLESGFNIDSGTSAQSGRLFGRQAFVGLEGGFGSFRLGRQYTPIGNVTDLVGTKNWDPLAIIGTYGSGGANGNTASFNAYRSDNAIDYKTPSFGGFTAELQYSPQFNGAETIGTVTPATGAVTSAKQGRQLGFNGIYANGPITAGLGYIQALDVNATTTTTAAFARQKRQEVILMGAYDFAVAKPTLYYVQTEGGVGVVQDAKKMRVAGLSVAVPFGAATITPSFTFAKDVNGSGTSGAGTKDDVKILELQSTYDLSKRTALYANLAVVSNEAAAYKGFNSPNLDQTSSGIQVGVRHRF